MGGKNPQNFTGTITYTTRSVAFISLFTKSLFIPTNLNKQSYFFHFVLKKGTFYILCCTYLNGCNKIILIYIPICCQYKQQ